MMAFSYPMMGGFGGFGVSPLWSIRSILIWILVLLGGYLSHPWICGRGIVKSDPA